MKYLYPYECEIEKLSDPQELQMAIDSNKRDRRHSETVDFMAPQIATCRAELEQAITPGISVNVATPVTHAVTSTQGLQLISSPTVALPQGSISPYPGGFIMASGPGGTHVMAPHLQHQLVHMAGPHSAIPIVLPASADSKSHEEEELSYDSESEPPMKKIGLDLGQLKASISNRIGSMPTPHSGSFIVAGPGGHHVVQTANLQQFFQMPGHSQMQPIVVAPSVSPTNRKSEDETFRKTESLTRKLMQLTSQTQNVTVENGVPVATFASHSLPSGMVFAPQRVSTSHLDASHLVQVPAHPHVPIMIPAGQRHGSGTVTSLREDIKSNDSIQEEDSEMGRTGHERPSVTTTRIPFANISIQSGECSQYINQFSGVFFKPTRGYIINENGKYMGSLLPKFCVIDSYMGSLAIVNSDQVRITKWYAWNMTSHSPNNTPK